MNATRKVLRTVTGYAAVVRIGSDEVFDWATFAPRADLAQASADGWSKFEVVRIARVRIEEITEASEIPEARS
jgi:hypothetical protein